MRRLAAPPRSSSRRRLERVADVAWFAVSMAAVALVPPFVVLVVLVAIAWELFG